jgi:ubiquinone/menaquinone biosynthesis C-methylase UbiE
VFKEKPTLKPLTAKELYAQLYDVYVSDWPGEIDFYRELIAHSPLKSSGVLEVACGTGRVAMQLAQHGIDITGVDISLELLEIARGKSSSMSTVEWLLGDMRSFEIGRKFGIVISPGHSFQFMTTPDDQVQCLKQIRHHLVPDGLAVIHIDYQDYGWLAGLLNQSEPIIKKGNPFIHPATGKKFRRSWSWVFEPFTQTATVQTDWEAIDDQGEVLQVWKMEPTGLHCVFPFEMEHLLYRAGFTVEAVYGDFFNNRLGRESEQMIWVARNKAG